MRRSLLVLIAAQARAQDEACRTRVGDCWGLSSADCAVSFDVVNARYRRCAGDPCDGDDEADCPAFSLCGEAVPDGCSGSSPSPPPEDDNSPPPPTPPPPPSDAVQGCTDDGASNYNPAAEAEDGSCEYPPLWPGGGAAEWDTDGDGVPEAFPAWITEPVNVTLPDGCVDDNCIGQSFTKDLPNGARHDAHGTHHALLMAVDRREYK